MNIGQAGRVNKLKQDEIKEKEIVPNRMGSAPTEPSIQTTSATVINPRSEEMLTSTEFKPKQADQNVNAISNVDTTGTNVAIALQEDLVKTALQSTVTTLLSKQSEITDKNIATVNSSFKQVIYMNSPTSDNGMLETQFTILSGIIPTIYTVEYLNKPDLMSALNIQDFSRFTNIEAVKQAQQCFGDGTVANRIVLKKEFGELNSTVCPRPMINDITVIGGRENWETTFNLLTNRFSTALRIYKAYVYTLVTDLVKISPTSDVSRGPIANQFSGTTWQNDNPHPYQAALTTKIDWFKERMEALSLLYPVCMDESDVDIINGMKKKASACVVIDQYTAHMLNMSSEWLETNVFDNDTYLKLLSSCGLPGNRYSIPLNLLASGVMCFNPPIEERRSYMWYQMVSDLERQRVMAMFKQWIESSGRLQNVKVANPLGQLATSLSGDSVPFIATLTDAINGGDSTTIIDLLILETFSGLTEITLTSSSVQNTKVSLLVLIQIAVAKILFPRICQRSEPYLSTILHTAIQQLFPAQYRDWTNRFGTWGRYVENDRGQRVWERRPSLSLSSNRAEVLTNYVSSLLGVQVNNRGDVMGVISNLLRPVTHTVQLERKRAAGTPYFSRNYQAECSWSPQALDNYGVLVQTEETNRIQAVLDFARSLVRRKQDGPNRYGDLNVNLVSSSPDANNLNNAIDAIAKAVTTFGPVIATMFRLQQWMMESPLFVYDGYNVFDRLVMPRLKVLNQSAAARIRGTIRHSAAIMYTKATIDISAFLGCLFTAEGEWTRSFTDGAAPYRQNLDRPENLFKTVTMPSPEKVLASWLMRLKVSRNFQVALAISSYVLQPDNTENPLREVAQQVRQFLRNSNFSHISNRIFNEFGIDREETLAILQDGAKAVSDMRIVSLSICDQDPETLMPINELNEEDYNGVPFDKLNEHESRVLKLACDIAMGENSPFIYNSRGLIIGKFYAGELDPYTAHMLRDQYPVVVNINDITWHDVQNARGQLYSMEVQGTLYTSLSTNMPKFLIQIDSVSSLTRVQYNFLKRSVSEGKVALEMPDQKFTYDIQHITDVVYDKTDIPINDILDEMRSVGAGSTLQCAWLSNRYGLNVNSLHRLNDGYVIHRIPSNPLLEQEFSGGIYGTHTMPNNAKIPSGQQTGIGRFQGGVSCYPGNVLVPKIRGRLINMNNKITYYTSRATFGFPSVEIIPESINRPGV